MFWKQVKPDMDDFKEEIYFRSTGKIQKELFNIQDNILKKFLNGNPCKNVTKYLGILFCSEHSKHFYLCAPLGKTHTKKVSYLVIEPLWSGYPPP